MKLALNPSNDFGDVNTGLVSSKSNFPNEAETGLEVVLLSSLCSGDSRWGWSRGLECWLVGWVSGRGGEGEWVESWDVRWIGNVGDLGEDVVEVEGKRDRWVGERGERT
jgi:hypothetical protein